MVAALALTLIGSVAGSEQFALLQVAMHESESFPRWSPGPGMCVGQEDKPKSEKPLQELTLIHIPRTGGTSIEDCTVGEDKDSDRWGVRTTKLSGRNDSNVRCYRQHVPPSVLDVDYFNGKNTFCVVRDPIDRLISQYGFFANNHKQEPHVCTKEHMNYMLLEHLRDASFDPSAGDCHFLQQSAYVYGWNKTSGKVDTSTQHCKHVLHFEPNLDANFNELMRAHGYSYRLEAEHRDAMTRSYDCQLGRKELSADVIKLANTVFADDYKLFGYEMMEAKDWSPSIFRKRTWPSFSPGPGKCPGQLKIPEQEKPRKNLTLIHIPRNAGMSMTECTVAETEDSDRWGKLAKQLDAQNGSNMPCYRKWVPPSVFDSDYFVGKNTFCVVRDPYDRLVSEYGLFARQHTKQRETICTKESMNQVLLEGLKQALVDPTAGQCHYLPQAAYVYSWNKKSGSLDTSTKHCQHVLPYEGSLDDNFNELMQEHGYSYRMEAAKRNDETRSYACKLTTEDLSDEVLLLANKIFSDDFKLFGYKTRGFMPE